MGGLGCGGHNNVGAKKRDNYKEGDNVTPRHELQLSVNIGT